MECGGLTSAMFSMPWSFAIPDILFSEELAERHAHLLQLGLISKTMSGELVSEAYSLRQQYIRASVNDLLALTLAKHERCQLLTGDRALREVAKKLSVEVHGTIWLIEQMLQKEKVTIEVARVAFHQMRDSGSRLPWNEIEKILNKDEASQA